METTLSSMIYVNQFHWIIHSQTIMLFRQTVNYKLQSLIVCYEVRVVHKQYKLPRNLFETLV